MQHENMQIVKTWEATSHSSQQPNQRASLGCIGAAGTTHLRYPRARLSNLNARSLDLDSCSPLHPHTRRSAKQDEPYFHGRWQVVHTTCPRGNLQHMPSARCGHTISLHGYGESETPSHLLVACGESSLNPKRDYFNDFYKLNLHSNVWTKVNVHKQTNLCPRADHSSAVFGDRDSKLLMYGGKCKDSYLDDLYVIHDVPSEKPKLQSIVFRTNPTGRRGASLTRCKTDGRFLLFGGQRGSLFFNDLWCLDLTSMKWCQMHLKKPPSYRAFHSAFVDFDDTLHILGGITDTNATPVGPEIHKCDLRAGTWVKMTGKDRTVAGFDKALSKGHHTSHLIKDRSDLAIYLQRGDAYVLGGHQGTKHCSQCLKIHVEPSDQNPKTYCRVPSAMWTDNVNNRAHLYIHGGYNPNAKKCTHNTRKLTFGIDACGTEVHTEGAGKENAEYLEMLLERSPSSAICLDRKSIRSKQGPNTPPRSHGMPKRKRDCITPTSDRKETKRLRASDSCMGQNLFGSANGGADTISLGQLIRNVESGTFPDLAPLEQRPLNLRAPKPRQNATPMRIPKRTNVESMYGTPQHSSQLSPRSLTMGLSHHPAAELTIQPQRVRLARTPIRVPVGQVSAPSMNFIQRDKSSDSTVAHKKIQNIDPDLLDDDEADTSIEHQKSLAWRTIHDIIVHPSDDLLEFHNPFMLDATEVMTLIDEAQEIFSAETSLLEFEKPVKVFGDIHGQLGDLLALFKSFGQPDHIMGDITTTKYLFMGDFVDRGHKSLEVMCLLLSLKIRYPERVFLIRGNHECIAMNELYGFKQEIRERLPDDVDDTVMEKFGELFDHLPLAALVSKRVLCVHGGVGHVESLEQIANIKRPCRLICDPDLIETITDQTVVDLMWSDPADSDDQNGFQTNSRGVSCVFGADVVRKFCKNNDLDLIVRAHQVVKDGYEYFAGGHLITLFSATNYCGQMDNAGAILCIDSNMRVTPKIVEASPNGSFWRKVAAPASPMRSAGRTAQSQQFNWPSGQ